MVTPLAGHLGRLIERAGEDDVIEGARIPALVRQLQLALGGRARRKLNDQGRIQIEEIK